MKKIFIALFLAFSINLAFAQTPVIKFAVPGLYPEGVAYHPDNKLFYVGSVTTATIGSVDLNGNYKPVFSDSTLKSTYGLKVDPSKKLLWACVSDANYSKYSEPATLRKLGRLIALDLGTGKKVKDIDLASLVEGKHFINDIVFDAEGNLYATDSFSPVIYIVDKTGKASVFVKSDFFKALDIGLNGIAFNPKGFFIVNNNSQGALYKVDLKNPEKISRVKIKNLFPGSDGMLFDDNGRLVVVQNKSVDKIFRLISNDDWQTAELESATAAEDRYQQPSTLTLVAKQVYILNSKMNELADPVKRPSKEFSIQRAEFKPVK
ncbi:gluconolaconase [Dyadobacter arcticus]|uniref:Sugar lactone lactonase YvrE n=1 Tax=Dyadobacter arcticus TaxID=1078754 RepID=A0ABX0UNE2_9BACT|nr:gluconolaconase [Dyadobacter arcticus]NIJ52970.1 sugar lactone lactonase YvrE [Dyadobacter arcticus]